MCGVGTQTTQHTAHLCRMQGAGCVSANADTTQMLQASYCWRTPPRHTAPQVQDTKVQAVTLTTNPTQRQVLDFSSKQHATCTALHRTAHDRVGLPVQDTTCTCNKLPSSNSNNQANYLTHTHKVSAHRSKCSKDAEVNNARMHAIVASLQCHNTQPQPKHKMGF